MVLAFLEKWLHLCPPSRVAELRTFCIMLRYGIAQFVGSWVSESGYHLRIKKVRKGTAAGIRKPVQDEDPSMRGVSWYQSVGI